MVEQPLEIDALDRQILRALKQDGRAAVSALAGRLGLARATVRARIDRLVETGVITRFTIETAPLDGDDPIRAVVLIGLTGSMSRAVIRSLSALPEIAQLHSTNGEWDLVAELECARLRDFDAALRRIREVPGVTNSQSCLLLDRVG